MAFTRLYADVQPRLIRYAAVLAGDDAAGDVTAASWLRLVAELPACSGDLTAFLTLAASITRQTALDARQPRGRAETRTESGEGDLMSEATSVRHGHSLIDVPNDLSVAEAVDVIRSLPQQHAEAVMLRAVIGLDDVSAGTVLGVPAAQVRASAHRGLTELRNLRFRRERAT